MPNRCASFLVTLILSGWFFPAANVSAYVSDGSDGVFAPQQSVDLAPDEDGVFHYSLIDIADQVLVSIVPQAWTDDIYLLSSGDINIAGLFNFADSNVHLVAAGNINISGRIYGSGTLNLSGGGIFLQDNPNGGPDQQLPDGGSLTLTADGEWDNSWDPGTIGGSSVTISGGLVDFDLFVLEEGNTGSGITIVHEGILATPLPAALWMFAPALLGLLRIRR